MAILTKQDIEQLSSIHSAFCISIFIPTHRAGKEVIEKLDAKALKNELKAVKTKLGKEELSVKEIDDLVHPIQQLIDNTGFWRYQSDGLAIFLSKSFFKAFTVPVRFEAFNYVANSFYLSPLMPMFVGDGSFYLLTLELEDVKLYEMTRHSITDVIVNDLIPARLEESVGYDYEEKNLQFRTQKEGYGAATFHGHAESDRARKNEITRHFRAIDKGLMTILNDKKLPMLIASQDYLFSIYKKVNTYKHLQKNHITNDPVETDKFLLHEIAWEMMAPVFDEERKEKIEAFKQYEGKGKTSSDIKQIVPAAFHGKIDTLFIENREDIFGIYHTKKEKVEIRKNLEKTNVSLLNMAAIKTFLQDGKVYLLEKDDMPNPYSKINALYRY
ncbi:MAG: hypothetical protein P8K68_07845 [Algibacter sp.]|uniref:baeRF7 domain-containing protein n=1 Tax=Algibacter sp. TaxID=1872428 RepID=UPI0026350F2D|nr:hypothetical protein [Algibacter sp.]MDG1729497.1 hypothetical protein [Algibacter sp.]MDG2178683.1 hypothetical protein [Algibacter sp.]